jgi:nitrogen fixation/metabolism regulation signal transduction histidine kinase
VSRRLLRFETRIFLLALAAAAPAVLATAVLLWSGVYPPATRWTVLALVALLALAFAAALRRRVVLPLQRVANLLQATREGDFSQRARGTEQADALSEVMREINVLGETLAEQRREAVEAEALLRKVIAEIDVALFTFDDGNRLRLVNAAGRRLMAKPESRLLGRSAEELELADLLAGPPARALERSFAGGEGRWEVRRSTFREGGLPHRLLVIADLSRVLREEERQAWRRLIRVLGHEMNNSLAPIRSMAATLASLLERSPPPTDWRQDMEAGLSIIAQRSESLSRFMAAYSRLARLPPPRLAPVGVGELARRVAAFESRRPVRVAAGPRLAVTADADQLEQLLINLLRNAVDAVEATGGEVVLSWSQRPGGWLEMRVDDDGPGLPATANLFVPFFTTKPGGTGIGLVLSRQIAEAHGGSLTLENRPTGGCRARLRLPLSPPPQSAHPASRQ